MKVPPGRGSWTEASPTPLATALRSRASAQASVEQTIAADDEQQRWGRTSLATALCPIASVSASAGARLPECCEADRAGATRIPCFAPARSVYSHPLRDPERAVCRTGTAVTTGHDLVLGRIGLAGATRAMTSGRCCFGCVADTAGD